MFSVTVSFQKVANKNELNTLLVIIYITMNIAKMNQKIIFPNMLWKQKQNGLVTCLLFEQWKRRKPNGKLPIFFFFLNGSQ